MVSSGLATLQSRILEEALSWIGTPYHAGMRQKAVGCDCGNFIGGVCEAIGVARLAPPEPYCTHFWLWQGSNFMVDEIRKALRGLCEGYVGVWGEPVEPGDIVLLTWLKADNRPIHPAFWAGAGTIVHAWGPSVRSMPLPASWRVVETVRIEEGA